MYANEDYFMGDVRGVAIDFRTSRTNAVDYDADVKVDDNFLDSIDLISKEAMEHKTQVIGMVDFHFPKENQVIVSKTAKVMKEN